MRKPDEIELYARLREARTSAYKTGAPWPNEIAEILGMPPNRMYYLLEKWVDKDWWEYGVSLRCGWFTEDAPEVLVP